MESFIFGKGTPWTYEQLQKKRAIAEALAMSNMGTPRNVGEGLTAIGRALAFRNINKKADKRDAELKGEFDSQFASAFGGYGSGGAYGGAGMRSTPSGTWTPATPPPSPVDVETQMFDEAKGGGLSFGNKPKADPGVIGAQGGLDFGAATMTPQEMLIEGAKRRGLDPIDVATAISYETGGRFDPMLAGPTTQWGTHRGLIQFGEPQAQQHGVDFSSPDAAWRSQLNPENGAIWSYLEGAGVQPGMGLPEVYSAINAGSVGRMGASDANNGGAPGTVADKVASMGPHRDKAAQFLGGTWTPTEGGGQTYAAPAGQGGGLPGSTGMDLGTLATLAASPYASPGQKAVISALMEQQMKAMDPMYQMEMQKAQLELDQLRNPTMDPMDAIKLKQAELDYQQDLTGGGADPATYGTTLQFFTDKDGKLRAGVLGNDGTMKEIEPPGGGDWAQGVDKVDAGTKWVFFDKRTGEKLGEEAKDLRAAEAEKAMGKAEGEAAGTAITGLSAAETKAAEGIALIDSIITDEALPGITGMIQGRLPPLTQAGTDLNVKIEQVQGKAFLEAFESLKGGGAISEREGEAATQAIARLQRSQSPEAYVEALNELKGILQTGLNNMKKRAGAAGSEDSGLTEDDLKYLE